MNSVEVKGLDSILLKLDSITEVNNIEGALGKACALVEREAKKKAPKDTGELRRSITSKVENNVGIVFTPLEYAPYVEYGTGLFAEIGGRKDVPWCYMTDDGKMVSTNGQKPQPFMRPALNENRAEIIRLLKEDLLSD